MTSQDGLNRSYNWSNFILHVPYGIMSQANLTVSLQIYHIHIIILNAYDHIITII